MKNGNVKGYSLKQKTLYHELCRRRYKVKLFAQKMGLTVDELKNKLKNKELFSKEQISKMVYILGAEATFNIIYFPTLEEKSNVYKRTFLHDENFPKEVH
jgi:hypothetical protein